MTPIDTAGEPAGPSPDGHQLRDLLAELLAAWRDTPARQRRRRDLDLSIEAASQVHGLAAHAHRLGHAVAALLDARFDIETAPTARLLFESAITAHWIAQVGDDAQRAVAIEKKKNIKNLINSLTAAQQIVLIAGADDLIAMLTAEAEVELPGSTAGKSFKDRCLTFTYGPKLYLDYRFLCDTGHPSTNLAHSYVEPVGPGEPLVFTELDRHAGDSSAELTATCSGLVWAAAAVDMLTEDRPRRDVLNRAAATLGIDVELALAGPA